MKIDNSRIESVAVMPLILIFQIGLEGCQVS